MNSMPNAVRVFFTALLLVGASTIAVAAQANASQAGAPVTKEVLVFGQKINYAEAGSGPTVILLHGLGGSWQSWHFNIAPLAEKYRVIVPDQIGFGKSDKPLVNYRIRTYVDFLDEFCKELKIERATLVGNSMGGWIAAMFTAAFPDRVDKLVLVDAAGYTPPKDLDTRLLFSLNPTTKEETKVLLAKVFYSKALQTDLAIKQSVAARLAAGDGYTIKSITESIIRGEDFLDDAVKNIRRPTLIVWGREDGLVALAEGQRFNKDIAGSKLIVFDQCGHVPNIEKATEFNAAVLKYLGEK